FTSPVAYVFLVIFLLLTGFFTFTAGNFFERGEASLAAFFGWHPWLYLVLVPAVGMRVWAEERRSGTLELLLTMPITPWQAVVAFILSVVLCLFLILAGFNPVTDLLTRWASPALVDTVAAFSVVTHFDGFQRGVIDLRDLVFFLSVIGFALFATGVIIRGHRAG